MKDKKSKFSLKSELRSRSTNFKPFLMEVSRNFLELLILSEGKMIILWVDLREAYIKSLHEMEELKRVQELRIDEFSRRRLIENQDTINELTARIQELQNEVSCTND